MLEAIPAPLVVLIFAVSCPFSIGPIQFSDIVRKNVKFSEKGLTPEPGDSLLQTLVSHSAGVVVSLLRTEVQVGEDVKAQVWIGVILSLTDVQITRSFSVSRP